MISKKENDLFDAIVSIQGNEECKSFFYDLCTPSEIEEFSTRWLIVKLLTKKKLYRQIAHETSVITTKISRVARFMKHGNDGYNSILNKLTVNK